MIKRLFVPFELADKARKLGFDEPVFTAYEVSDKSLIENLSDDSGYFFEQVCKNPVTIPAPLYDQIETWLRKTHQLHIRLTAMSPTSSKDDCWHWKIQLLKNLNDGDSSTIKGYSNFVNGYEAARDSAIEKALSLIGK